MSGSEVDVGLTVRGTGSPGEVRVKDSLSPLLSTVVWMEKAFLEVQHWS